MVTMTARAVAATVTVDARAGRWYGRETVAGTGDDDDIAAVAALMGRYCDGEQAAFHALYAKVAPRLLGYLRGLVRDRATAEDLLQLTFLKAHEARAAYVRGADPLPWLYTIAHRTALDELRRQGRARARFVDEPGPADEPRATIDGAAEAAPVVEERLSEETAAALARLPESQREALLLTHVHGRSHAEAAEIAGTTPGAIKLRAHRAYVTLRKLLGGTRRAHE
jgi:RNA polymerase sigma-70 factor (ECF subfamily)